MVDALGTLHAYGHELSWKKLFPRGGQCISLPTYAWQKDRYWLPDDIRSRLPSTRHHTIVPFADPDVHPLLGTQLVLSIEPTLHVWESALCIGALPYLSDHRVQDEAVFPGAGYVEMALAAITELHGNLPTLLEEVSFDRMLPIGKEPDRRVQVVIIDDTAEHASFRISSRDAAAASWVQHAAGQIRMGMGVPVARIARDRPRVIQARCSSILNSHDFYGRMDQGGLAYGKSFRGIETFWIGQREALARCFLHPDHFGTVEKYQVHPALLDACFQALVGIHLATLKEVSGTYVLSGVERLRIHRSLGTDIWVHAELHAGDDGSQVFGDVFVIDAEGRVVAEVNGLGIKHLESSKAASTSQLEDAVYAIEWRKKDLEAEIIRSKPSTSAGAWLFFIDDAGTAASMSFLLAARGEACIRVRRGTRFARVETGLYEIEPGNSEHYQRLLREAFGREVTCKGIVHLFALDATPWDLTTTTTISQDIEQGCLSVMYLVQAMARQGWRDTPRLWLVTRGAQAVSPTGAPLCVSQSTLWGLGRTIALEHPEVECTRVDMDPVKTSDEAALLWREISARSREDQIAYRKDGRYVARLVKSSFEASDTGEVKVTPQPASGRAFRLESLQPGVLDQLFLREFTRRPPGLGEVEIEIEAAGLNFVDIMRAMGFFSTMTSGELQLGLECAGRIVAIGEGVEDLQLGQEVIVLAPHSFASHVTVLAVLVVPKPAQMSFAEAASIPIVFTTVYYALNKIGRLGQDERILIHTATGGTGLAAIQLARFLGAEIFATAGSPEKREYLESLAVPHVMDSRTLDFAGQVLEATGGEGVDIVLNTLTGDGRARSLEILAPYGRFLELSKRDIYDNAQLAMNPFRRSLSYTAVDLAGMIVERPALVGSLFREVMKLFEMGVFTAIPTVTFPFSEIREAYRYMAQAKHVGKIVVTMDDRNVAILSAEQSRSTIEPDATYLITGGLGGLGIGLAQWMVEHGARHLALVGRNAPSEYAQQTIDTLRSAGADVTVLSADVADATSVSTMLGEISAKMPPLRGIVHAAGILDDKTLLELDAERFLRVLAPKVAGAMHLHHQTLHEKLDFFVSYSSSASLLGAPGQGNYAAANAFLDALAHTRTRLGLPGISIHWGPFSELGLASAQANRGKRMADRGIESLTPAQGFLAFARLLEKPRAEVGIVRLSVHQWVEYYPQIADSPFWSELQREKKATELPASSRASFKQSLERRPPQERLAALEQHILEHVSQVLRLDISRIDRLSSFTSLGMDSLMSLELRNRLESSLGVRLSATLLFTYANPASLADYLLERMSVNTAKQRTADTTATVAAVSLKPSDRTSTNIAPEGVKAPATVSIRQMSLTETELLLEEELARSEDYLQ